MPTKGADMSDIELRVAAKYGRMELDRFFDANGEEATLEVFPLIGVLGELFRELCLVNQSWPDEPTYGEEQIGVDDFIDKLASARDTDVGVVVGEDPNFYVPRHTVLSGERVGIWLERIHGQKCLESFSFRRDEWYVKNYDGAMRFDIDPMSQCGLHVEAPTKCGVRIKLIFNQRQGAPDAAFKKFVRHWALQLADAYEIKQADVRFE